MVGSRATMWARSAPICARVACFCRPLCMWCLVPIRSPHAAKRLRLERRFRAAVPSPWHTRMHAHACISCLRVGRGGLQALSKGMQANRREPEALPLLPGWLAQRATPSAVSWGMRAAALTLALALATAVPPVALASGTGRMLATGAGKPPEPRLQRINITSPVQVRTASARLPLPPHAQAHREDDARTRSPPPRRPGRGTAQSGRLLGVRQPHSERRLPPENPPGVSKPPRGRRPGQAPRPDGPAKRWLCVGGVGLLVGGWASPRLRPARKRPQETVALLWSPLAAPFRLWPRPRPSTRAKPAGGASARMLLGSVAARP